MDPKDVRKALEGHENVLEPALEEMKRYFRFLSCVNCGGEVYPFVDARQLFKPGAVLPNYMARCKACGAEFEPYTKIEVRGPAPPKGL